MEKRSLPPLAVMLDALPPQLREGRAKLSIEDRLAFDRDLMNHGRGVLAQDRDGHWHYIPADEVRTGLEAFRSDETEEEKAAKRAKAKRILVVTFLAGVLAGVWLLAFAQMVVRELFG